MELRVERSFPLPKAHNRLRQTHDLWHEMQSADPDADEFVTKLNACLTAARSVTFVLQKELSHTSSSSMSGTDRGRSACWLARALRSEDESSRDPAHVVSAALAGAGRGL
jgi:hypothetical protein